MTKKVIIAVCICLVFVLSGCANTASNTAVSNANQSSTATANLNSSEQTAPDANLVGQWQTDCLVPDLNSPWAEQHFFSIRADGTATHIRKNWDAAVCTDEGFPVTTEYAYSIPSSGKINLTSDEGGLMLDMYELSDANSTLKFGHGFRNNYAYGSSDSAGRPSSLNEYIIYKKASN